MDTQPFLEASRELRHRFIMLIDSLSGLRALTGLDGEHSESELLGGALKVLLQTQDLERCSVFLLNQDRLVCRVGRDWNDQIRLYESPPRSTPYVFALGEGILGRAAQRRALMHVPDCTLDDRFLPIARKDHEGSLICVPIEAGDKLLGVLNVSHPRTDFFHPWHDNVLRLFSAVLGQMLGHQRLLAEMEALVRERTRKLEETLQYTEELKERYEQLAVVDELTEIYNRRFFFPEASAELSRAARNAEPFSLVLIDIDHFKQINDTYGHAVGDGVLRSMAAALAERTREGDILARFGGEEFVLALPTTGAEGAKQLALRMQQAINALRWPADGGEVRITVSMGITSPSEPPPAKEPEFDPRGWLELLLKQADGALYHAKAQGRDRASVFQELPRELQASINQEQAR